MIINRGKEQAAQHSQSIQSIYCHIFGLKVVMPSTPYDAKGLLISSVLDDNPVIYIDDRWLYDSVGDVPEEMYKVPIGEGIIRKEGSDLTIVSYSFMATECLKAAEILEEEGFDVEIIDLRSLSPMDFQLVAGSLKKTKRLLVADGASKSFGVGAEVLARVAETELVHMLEAPISRVCFPDTPVPAAETLEKTYYTDHADVVESAMHLIEE
jgi:pyruvate dehydrogenase E1 component beta subunit